MDLVAVLGILVCIINWFMFIRLFAGGCFRLKPVAIVLFMLCNAESKNAEKINMIEYIITMWKFYDIITLITLIH